MSDSLRLGEIAGVRVGMHWTVPVIVVLIGGGLAAGRLPLEVPDEATSAYVVAGVGAAALFLASLLAHELSHALVARRDGQHVECITVWLFGGVARLTGEAPDAAAQLRVAGVGPLVSGVVSGAFAAGALAADATGLPDLVVAVLEWLALLNLVLAIANLVPAAPLDGGRIVHAFLWNRRGERAGSAVLSARAGRVVGFLLIALGLLAFALAVGFEGLWLVLLGWVLVNAAAAEEEHAKVRGTLGDVRVGDVMSARPVTAPGALTIAEFVDCYVFHHRFSAFPLTEDGGRPVGLVTLNRIKQVPWDQRTTTRVADIACALHEVPLACPGEPLTDLLARMAGCADGRALVVHGGRVVGIVSPTDIARRLERTELRSPQDVSHV